MGLSPSAGVFPAVPPSQPIQILEGELPQAGSISSIFIKTTNRGSASRCPRAFLWDQQKLDVAVGALEKSIIPSPAAPCPTEPLCGMGVPMGRGVVTAHQVPSRQRCPSKKQRAGGMMDLMVMHSSCT